MIVLLPYLLQKLLLKTLDTAEYLSIFKHYVNAIKNVHQKPNINQIQVSTKTPEQEFDLIQSATIDFVETSFEAIWQNCPPDESIWDDQPIHQEHNDER